MKNRRNILLIIILVLVSCALFVDPASEQVVAECKFRPRLHFYAPILMYHRIGLIRPQQSYYVSPEIFEKQMQWLKDHDYHVISIGDFQDAISCGWDLPENPTVITFDDGALDQYENAFPVLKKFGYTATFYVTTGFVGDGGHVTWDMLREMRDAGMTIGSHTVTHPNVVGLWKYGLGVELLGSKNELEKELGVPVLYFAYPGGDYSKYAADSVKEYGYLNAVTTSHAAFHDIKTEDDFYTLKRIHIDDEMPSFTEWIQGVNLK